MQLVELIETLYGRRPTYWETLSGMAGGSSLEGQTLPIKA